MKKIEGNGEIYKSLCPHGCSFSNIMSYCAPREGSEKQAIGQGAAKAFDAYRADANRWIKKERSYGRYY